jgi:hypothetical protein
MKYDYNLEIFRNKNDIFYYLLGALLTDGNIFYDSKYHLIQMTSKDSDWLSILQEKIRCAVYPTKDNHGNLSISSEEICKILIDNGCVPNKSLKIRLPIVPEKYLPDLIRGCIDGDGCIPNGKQIQSYLCSSSKDFLDDVKNILDKQQITSNIYEIKKKPYTLKNGKTITPKNKHYRLLMHKKSTKQLLEWIYYPDHELSMPRKNIIAQRIISTS